MKYGLLARMPMSASPVRMLATPALALFCGGMSRTPRSEYRVKALSMGPDS